MHIETLFNSRFNLAEGPLWHPEEKVLYWIEYVGQQALHRYNPKTQDFDYWDMEYNLGALAPCATGGLVGSYHDGLAHIDTSDAAGPKITMLVEGVLANKLDKVRWNDGKADPQGRFWAGTACNDPDEANPSGELYCFNPDGTYRVMETGIRISNGLAWNADSTKLYYNDSYARLFSVYDFDAATGEISNRQVLDSWEGGMEPDGMTIDTDGYLWTAEWGGHCLRRYAPDGVLDKEIEMPVERPTSLMFGGEDYSVLYVTTCAEANDGVRLPEPAGSILALHDLGVRGHQENAYNYIK